jgi:hypothetical protein
MLAAEWEDRWWRLDFRVRPGGDLHWETQLDIRASVALREAATELKKVDGSSSALCEAFHKVEGFLVSDCGYQHISESV